MTNEDYRFMITLVVSVAGLQLIIMLAFGGLMYQAINKRLELIEGRLDKLEDAIKLIKA